MTATLPDHDQLADTFLRLGALYPPAELHGFFMGQLVIGQRIDEQALRKQVMQLLDCDAIPDADWAQLMELYQAGVTQLGGDIEAMTLLLPDPEFDLGQRVSALGSWCQGFLTGFAMAGRQRENTEGKQAYGESVSEMLNDIAAISQAGLDAAEDALAEQQFDELVGYIETAVVSLFVQCCGETAVKDAHPAPKQIH